MELLPFCVWACFIIDLSKTKSHLPRCPRALDTLPWHKSAKLITALNQKIIELLRLGTLTYIRLSEFSWLKVNQAKLVCASPPSGCYLKYEGQPENVTAEVIFTNCKYMWAFDCVQMTQGYEIHVWITNVSEADMRPFGALLPPLVYFQNVNYATESWSHWPSANISFCVLSLLVIIMNKGQQTMLVMES